jgi:hypothetical protein
MMLAKIIIPIKSVNDVNRQHNYITQQQALELSLDVAKK